MRELASGTNQPNLNAQMIKDYKIVVPPIEIQRQIISHYQKESDKVNELNSKGVLRINNSLYDFERKIFNIQ